VSKSKPCVTTKKSPAQLQVPDRTYVVMSQNSASQFVRFVEKYEHDKDMMDWAIDFLATRYKKGTR